MSVTGVTAFNAVLYTGLHYTGAINATLVNATTPVTTAVIAWLVIGEQITRRRRDPRPQAAPGRVDA